MHGGWVPRLRVGGWGLRGASGWGRGPGACRLASRVRVWPGTHRVHHGGGRPPALLEGFEEVPASCSLPGAGPSLAWYKGRGAFIWHLLPVGYLWAAGHLSDRTCPQPPPRPRSQHPVSSREPLHALGQPRRRLGSHGVGGGVVSNTRGGAEHSGSASCPRGAGSQGPRGRRGHSRAGSPSQCPLQLSAHPPAREPHSLQLTAR